MKYEVTICTKNEDEITAPISCRRDAKWKSLVRKAAEGILLEMQKAGIDTEGAMLYAEAPNVWTNGGCGFASIEIGGWSYHMVVQREDGLLELN